MDTVAGARIIAIAAQGPGSGDERRLLELLADHAVEPLAFDRGRRVSSAVRLTLSLVRGRPALVVAEGTGLGVGIPMMLARLVAGVPYVVSSGDAVGPFLRLHGRLPGLVGAVYERLLYRLSAGVVGWTPYLAGRALTFGAPRAVTAAGWAVGGFDADARRRIRAEHGIPDGTPVFGIVGSLTWTASKDYCYGLELVRAIRSLDRDDVRVLIVGDGDGLPHLRRLADGDPRIVFTGRVEPTRVGGLLSAMDVASLPQTRDGVGLFRYTTKLSDYLAAGLPVATGRLPFAYDLSRDSILSLPGKTPWDPSYVRGLAELMSRSAIPPRAHHPEPVFDRAAQRARVGRFVADVVQEHGERHPLGPSGRRRETSAAHEADQFSRSRHAESDASASRS